MYKEVIIFLISCLVLVKGADYAITAATRLARTLRLTEFVTSFILVAIISALPETFVSITSALQGDPGIGLGTILGGNIADLTLILGLVALASHPLRIHSSIIKKDIYFAALILLPILLGLDGLLSRIDATILLIAGLTFIIVLLRERTHFHKAHKDGNHWTLELTILIVSVGIMIISAHYVVSTAHIFALSLGVPSLIIGLILTALGTTLPEFTFALRSVRKGYSDFAIGDLLGVVVVDATLVLAITIFIMPIAVNTTIFTIIGLFTAITVLFALLFMRTDNVLTKNEAMTLILFYIAFIVVQILLR